MAQMNVCFPMAGAYLWSSYSSERKRNTSILNDDIFNNEQISFSIFTFDPIENKRAESTSPHSFLSTSFIDGEKKLSKQRSALSVVSFITLDSNFLANAP